jgi:hypothetical protein
LQASLLLIGFGNPLSGALVVTPPGEVPPPFEPIPVNAIGWQAENPHIGHLDGPYSIPGRPNPEGWLVMSPEFPEAVGGGAFWAQGLHCNLFTTWHLHTSPNPDHNPELPPALLDDGHGNLHSDPSGFVCGHGLLSWILDIPSISFSGYEHAPIGSSSLNIVNDKLEVTGLATCADGVSMDLCGIDNFNVKVDPIDVSLDGAILDLAGEGVVSGLSHQPIGAAHIENVANCLLEIGADFSPLGTGQYLYEVKLSGVPVSSGVLNNTQFGMIRGVPALTLKIESVGLTSLRPPSEPGFHVILTDPVIFDFGQATPSPVLGNEVCVYAHNNGFTAPDTYETFSINACKLDQDQIIICLEDLIAPGDLTGDQFVNYPDQAWFAISYNDCLAVNPCPEEFAGQPVESPDGNNDPNEIDIDWCRAIDLNDDCEVDLDDFREFSDKWLQCTAPFGDPNALPNFPYPPLDPNSFTPPGAITDPNVYIPRNPNAFTLPPSPCPPRPKGCMDLICPIKVRVAHKQTVTGAGLGAAYGEEFEYKLVPEATTWCVELRTLTADLFFDPNQMAPPPVIKNFKLCCDDNKIVDRITQVVNNAPGSSCGSSKSFTQDIQCRRKNSNAPWVTFHRNLINWSRDATGKIKVSVTPSKLDVLLNDFDPPVSHEQQGPPCN